MSLIHPMTLNFSSEGISVSLTWQPYPDGGLPLPEWNADAHIAAGQEYPDPATDKLSKLLSQWHSQALGILLERASDVMEDEVERSNETQDQRPRPGAHVPASWTN